MEVFLTNPYQYIYLILSSLGYYNYQRLFHIPYQRQEITIYIQLLFWILMKKPPLTTHMEAGMETLVFSVGDLLNSFSTLIRICLFQKKIFTDLERFLL